MSKMLRMSEEEFAKISSKAVPSITAVPERPSKYRSRKTGGYASKKEAERAAQLKLLESAGKIRELCEQVPFELIPSQEGERPCRYFADFVYQEMGPYGNWLKVVEDCKGMRTREYVLKRKLMLWVHKVKIRET